MEILVNNFIFESLRIIKESIDSLRELESKYPVKIDFKYGDNYLYIVSIVVDKNMRGAGIGGKVMGDIIQYANDNKIAITLTPEETFGTPIKVLNKFYKKYGFVKNTDKNKIGKLIYTPK